MSTNDQAAAFRAAAQALNEAADKELRKQVYAAFRKASKPLGETVIREGSAKMPHRGGLSARLATAKLSQSNSTTGRNPGITLRIKSREGYELPALDRGRLRHPVFGRRRRWVLQRVPARAFSTPFEQGREQVANEVTRALEDVAQDIARQTRRAS